MRKTHNTISHHYRRHPLRAPGVPWWALADVVIALHDGPNGGTVVREVRAIAGAVRLVRALRGVRQISRTWRRGERSAVARRCWCRTLCRRVQVARLPCRRACLLVANLTRSPVVQLRRLGAQGLEAELHCADCGAAATSMRARARGGAGPRPLQFAWGWRSPSWPRPPSNLARKPRYRYQLVSPGPIQRLRAEARWRRNRNSPSRPLYRATL